MQTYSEFRPTGFDARGLSLPDKQEWLVLPIGRNRDSGILETSNWYSALAQLGGESDTVEIHRFGHWACGWFEIVLIDPADSTASETAQALADTLEEYAVLSDADYSERQWNAARESWERADIRDRYHALTRYARNVSIFAIRHAQFPQDDSGDLLAYMAGEI